MLSPDIMDPDVIAEMFAMTPGAVLVTFGGVETYGHFEHVPEGVLDSPGVLASAPTVVVPSGALPGVGLCDEEGSARGVGEAVTVGDFVWTVRAVEPGTAPGEIRLLLANR